MMQKTIRKKSNIFVKMAGKVILILLVLYAVGNIVNTQIQISQAREQVNELADEADIRQRTLAELEAQNDGEENESELLEQAHEKGYLLPGERIFEDSQNN